ncbi:sugar transporter ERD6-like 16 isoform X1 [Telopea speciosissima]|uniref:sugar transporter ERD6-like 16 isoform X1 n=2 Tax=Telopea speciosissima TaxID=54955 RepID=UPI001CC65F46|nr:sugar transporter ERD6-like 16 isoform X1 [Telopea speciosissima]
MAINEDNQNGKNKGTQELREPFIPREKVNSYEEVESHKSSNRGTIGMVVLSTAVSVCGAFEFGSCVGYSAPTQSAIREDLQLSLPEYSMFGSILTIGAMIGAVTSGHISDFIGRKGAMVVSALFCIAGWLAVYLAKGALLLDIGRVFTGYGCGVFSYVVPVFIAEIAPKNLRGGLTTVNQLMIVVGSSVAFLVGSVVTWRTLALTGLVPCILLLLGLFFVPESPRWLAKMGHQKDFESAMQRLRGKDADITEEVTEIQDYIETLQSLPKAGMVDLFQRKYIRALIIGVGLMVLQQFGGINGIGFYVSETFISAGSSGKTGTIAYACVQVPITLLGALLMDISGRRPLIMISATGTFLGCFFTGMSFFLKGHDLLPEWAPMLAVAGVLIYIGSFAIGMGPVPWVIMSEIFPINVKGAAGSVVTLVCWFGAWAVSYTFNSFMDWSSAGTFFFYSGVSAITVLFVAKFVPETKDKTLEEIQASINM